MKNNLNIPARPHPFPMDIEHCAVLIIDMQNDFLVEEGGCPRLLGLSSADLEPVRAIIPKISRVLDWARAVGIVIVFTREAVEPDLSDLTLSKKIRYENAGYPVGTPGPMGRLLVKGEPGSQIIPEFRPHESDTVLDKPAQSVFIGTNLEALLKEKGITHLLLTGVTTQCCVLATYRQGNDLGFFSLLLEDCCAAFSLRDHTAALDVVASEGGAVGWVTTSERLMSLVS
jgi:nicotinamidase-related amidase